MNTSKHNVIASGARGLVCAGISMIITAFFSWSFVASTNSLDWMGSDALKAPAIAMTHEGSGRGAVTTPDYSMIA